MRRMIIQNVIGPEFGSNLELNRSLLSRPDGEFTLSLEAGLAEEIATL